MTLQLEAGKQGGYFWTTFCFFNETLIKVKASGLQLSFDIFP